MSKDYLLVDHKERCWDCELLRIEETYEIPFCGKTGGKVMMDGKPDWCPLRPLPEQATPENSDMGINWNLGWNACLDAITGGEE